MRDRSIATSSCINGVYYIRRFLCGCDDVQSIQHIFEAKQCVGGIEQLFAKVVHMLLKDLLI